MLTLQNITIVLYFCYNCQVVQRAQGKEICNLDCIQFHIVPIENDIYVCPPWYNFGFGDGGMHGDMVESTQNELTVFCSDNFGDRMDKNIFLLSSYCLQ